MTTPIITEQFNGLTNPASVRGQLKLVASVAGDAVGYATASGKSVAGLIPVSLNDTGALKLIDRVSPVVLNPNHGNTSDVINMPTGTVWELTLIFPGEAPTVRWLDVGDSAGTFRVDQVLSSLPGSLPVPGMAPLASPAFTGTPTAPTAAPGTNTTQLATTAFTQQEIAAKAPLASPVLTGTPTAPTAAVDTSTTQLATTAFVQAGLAPRRASLGGDANRLLGSNTDATAPFLASRAVPTIIQKAGQANFNAVGGGVQLPDGRWLAVYRSGTADANNKGEIWGNLSASSTARDFGAQALIYSDATNDARDPCVSMLRDGRVALSFFTASPTATGTRFVGSTKVMIGTVGPSSITWASPVTVSPGLAGFDSCSAPVVDIDGSHVILPIYGHVSRATTANPSECGYAFGTYTAGGAITWAGYQTVMATSAAKQLEEPSIVVCANGDWLMTARNTTDSTVWVSRLTAGTGGITGTGTWSAAGVGAGGLASLFAAPRMTVLASGRIVLASRGSSTVGLATHGYFTWSDDHGLGWATPVAFDTRNGITGFNYGQFVEAAGKPGLVAWIGSLQTSSSVCDVELIWFSDAAGALSPAGDLFARSLVVGDGGIESVNGFIGANGGKLSWVASQPPTLSGMDGNADLYLSTAQGPTWGWEKSHVGQSGGLASVQPVPFPGVSSLTDVGINYEPYPRIGTSIVDLTLAQLGNSGTPWASGTMLVMAFPVRVGTNVPKCNILCGGTVPGTPTHAWTVWYDSTGAKLDVSNDRTNSGWTARSIKTFTPGAGTFQAKATGYMFLGLVIVAATLPTLMGVLSDTAVLNQTGIAPILVFIGPTGLTLTTDAPATLTIPTPTSGSANSVSGSPYFSG